MQYSHKLWQNSYTLLYPRSRRDPRKRESW